ncbi:MAG: hypothetical protein Q7S82_01700 [bacterium]|nr:hypothetical protein [bacterium]
MYIKIFGWILLIAGLILIGWTLFNSYNVFTAKSQPPEFFKAEKAVSAGQGKIGSQDIQAQLEKMIGEQLKGLLPADTLPKMLNLTVWSMLAFILISGGGQISGIGIKLMKNRNESKIH